MKIISHFSPKACGQGLCPGIIVTDRATVLIQGYVLPKADKSTLSVPAQEDVVEIPRAIFEDLLGQYKGQ